MMRDPASHRDVARLERSVEFARCQLRSGGPPAAQHIAAHRPLITISRQAGTGAHAVGDDVVAILEARAPDAGPWAVFDRNLVDRILEDHGFPQRWAEFMPEDRVSGIRDSVDELFGLHPSSWTFVRKAAETILRLAELGNVVFIGRGANVVTGHLPHAFHVRLIGSLDRRVERIRAVLGFDEEQGQEHVRRVDLGRARYLKKYLGKDIDDPLLYHLLINTDRLTFEQAARLIADAVTAHTSHLEAVAVT